MCTDLGLFLCTLRLSRLINEHEQALLVVGMSDGVMRIWQDYDTNASVLTSWKAGG